MGCGKAFYHRSIIACIKAMNLNKYKGAHTHSETNVRARRHMRELELAHLLFGASFLQNILGEKLGGGGKGGVLRLPAFPTVSALFPPFLLLPPPILLPLCLLRFALHAWVQGEKHKRNTWQTRMWSSFSHCHTTLLPVLPPSLPPSLIDSPFTVALARMANKAFSKRRKEEEEEVCPHHHLLHLSLPSSLSQLAFHTPGSAIQTRSCMYMSLSANNTSLLTPTLRLRVCRSISVQIRPGEGGMRSQNEDFIVYTKVSI